MKISREEYLWQLSQQLYGIPAEEREAALEYYRNYFEEAGTEHEQQVMAELGSPEQLAKSIIADVMDESRHDTVGEPLVKRDDASDSREPNWEQYRRQMDAETQGSVETGGAAVWSERETGRKRSGKGVNPWMILCLVLTCPVWGGILIGVLGAIIGLVCGIFGLAVGLVVTVIALIVALLVGGVIGIVKALISIITAPFAAGFAICLSIVMIAVSVLLLKFVFGIGKHLAAGMFKGIGKLCSGALNGIVRMVRRILAI
jgi:hypothetical protein